MLTKPRILTLLLLVLYPWSFLFFCLLFIYLSKKKKSPSFLPLLRFLKFLILMYCLLSGVDFLARVALLLGIWFRWVLCQPFCRRRRLLELIYPWHMLDCLVISFGCFMQFWNKTCICHCPSSLDLLAI